MEKMIANPRVLQLLPTLSRGGAELYVQRLCRHQAKGRWSPFVCSMLRGGPVEDLLQQDGTPFQILGISRHSASNPILAAWDFFRIYRGVLAIARRQKVELIQTHLSDCDWIGMCVARKLNLPVILTFHSSKLVPPERSAGEWRARLRRWLQSREYRNADALIAVGSDVQESLLQFPGVLPERVHLIPSAIEIPPVTDAETLCALREKHASWCKGSPILVTVGRLVKSKGHDRLIEMMPQVLQRHPDAVLWIIGDGPEKDSLEISVRRLGLKNKILFLGAQDEIHSLLALADLYVTGTRREGLGLALAEGMASRLPVVAFRVPGVVDIVQDGSNGRLVNEGDLAAFAEASSRLLEDPELRQRLGAVGRETARKFEITTVSAATEALYDSLLKKTAMQHD